MTIRATLENPSPDEGVVGAAGGPQPGGWVVVMGWGSASTEIRVTRKPRVDAGDGGDEEKTMIFRPSAASTRGFRVGGKHLTYVQDGLQAGREHLQPGFFWEADVLEFTIGNWQAGTRQGCG